jgi:hypothetical protein
MNIRSMVMRKLRKKRAREIALWYLRLKLKTKLMTGLIVVRSKATK